GVPGLRRAAAGGQEEHGLGDDAVRHALAAGEARWAARLVERHAESLLRRSEGATLGRWLSALPAGVVRARPRLYLTQAISAIVGGHLEAAQPLLADPDITVALTGGRPS